MLEVKQIPEDEDLVIYSGFQMDATSGSKITLHNVAA